jgi:hypothetical protein
MTNRLDRRRFLGRMGALSAGAAAALSFEERALVAQAAAAAPAVPAPGTSALPTGRLGPLAVSRLIVGGNLLSGFAHSRDLIYVSPLLRRYFTDDKVCDTFELCEEHGINTAIVRVDSQTLRIWKKYRSERGGKLQWIAQVKLTEQDLDTDIKLAVDAGAVGCYVHGGVCDTLAGSGTVDVIGRALDCIKRQRVVSGLGAHAIATTKACVAAGLDPDFYMKTFNAKNYWSATIPERNDSVWEETPEETRAFMATVKKPWIAFKVLGAGAIPPADGFAYAYRHGADFLCVGMFDFQITEDVVIARNAIAAHERRDRPWCA